MISTPWRWGKTRVGAARRSVRPNPKLVAALAFVYGMQVCRTETVFVARQDWNPPSSLPTQKVFVSL